MTRAGQRFLRFSKLGLALDVGYDGEVYSYYPASPKVVTVVRFKLN